MWWEGFVGGGMGEFAEARRRLMSKIEGCEDTHQYMLNKHLMDRGVSLDNYYRLNVDVGVGEFGMNEWNRLADISTNTRRYLATMEVQGMNNDAAAKLARIHRSHERWLQTGDNTTIRYSWEVDPPAPPAVFGAVELPAEDVPSQPHFAPQHPPPSAPQQQQSSGAPSPQLGLLQPQDLRRPNDDDKFVVQAPEPKDWEHRQQNRPNAQQQQQAAYPPRRSNESGRPAVPAAPHNSTPNLPLSQRPSTERPPSNRSEPPPIPPKTPINAPAVLTQQQLAPPLPPSLQSHHQPQQQQQQQQQGPQQQKTNMTRPPGGINVAVLPYPESDGPPGAPPVNWGRKPDLGGAR